MWLALNRKPPPSRKRRGHVHRPRKCLQRERLIPDTDPSGESAKLGLLITAASFQYETLRIGMLSGTNITQLDFLALCVQGQMSNTGRYPRSDLLWLNARFIPMARNLREPSPERPTAVEGAKLKTLCPYKENSAYQSLCTKYSLSGDFCQSAE